MPTKKSAKKATKKTAKRKPLISKKQREEFKVEGRRVVGKVKELIKEGNVRQIVVKDKNGKQIFNLPVTAGVVGAVFLPALVVLGALVAFVSECTITVVRK